MRRVGFTVVEMMVVVMIVGVLALLGFPKIRRALDKANVRSARAYLGTAVATGRAVAVQRGCRAVVHFTSGASGTVWVTACSRTNPAPAVDTIGGVEPLASRYRVTLTATRDSIQFDPRGLSMDGVTTTVQIAGAIAGGYDSLLVNTIGKVMR